MTLTAEEIRQRLRPPYVCSSSPKPCCSATSVHIFASDFGITGNYLSFLFVFYLNKNLKRWNLDLLVTFVFGLGKKTIWFSQICFCLEKMRDGKMTSLISFAVIWIVAVLLSICCLFCFYKGWPRGTTLLVFCWRIWFSQFLFLLMGMMDKWGGSSSSTDLFPLIFFYILFFLTI